MFTSGNPGSTSREEPVAQLELLRNLELPAGIAYLSTLNGVLWQYGRAGAQQTQDAQDELFGIENSLKVYTGWQQTLANPAVIAGKRTFEDGLKAWIGADPKRRTQFGDPWAKLAPALAKERQLYIRYGMIEGSRTPRGFMGDLFGYAIPPRAWRCGPAVRRRSMHRPIR